MKIPKWLKTIGAVVAPLVRGTVKSLPGGSLMFEVINSIKHVKDPAKAGDQRPHSPISILAQVVFLAVIVYAFYTKQITIDDVMNYIVPDDFKHVGGLPNDSIR